MDWRGLRLKTRKICTVGFIESVSGGGRFTDVVLSHDGASVLVRVWSDSSAYESVADISTSDAVKVLGTLRVFRENVYVSPLILRKVGPDYLLEFAKRVERDRELIFASLAGRVPAGGAREG